MKESGSKPASRVTLLYVLFAGVWILLSDQFLAGLVRNIDLLTRLQTYKGWIFVVVSAGFLYFLLRGEIRRRDRIEQSHRESEARYRMLIEQASDGIFLSDFQGNYIDVNSSGCAMLGYSRDDLLHLNISDLVPHEDLSDLRASQEALLSGKKILGEHRLRRKDGSYLPVEISARKVDGGYLQAIVRDITERKQAEQALQKWADIFYHARTGLVIGESGSELLGLMNPAFASMHGFSVEELTGKPLRDVFASECHSDLRRNLQTAIEKGHDVFEAVNVRKDGSTFPVLLDITVVKNEKGEICYSIATVQDISEQKIIETALRESEERFRVALKNSPILVFNQDRELRYTWIYNSQAGLAPESILGKTDADLLPPESALPLFELKRRVIQTGVGIREEVRVQPDKQPIFFDLTIEPTRSPNSEITGITGAGMDITDRVQAKELIEKQLHHLDALRKIDIAITATMDLRVTLEVLLEQVTNELGVDASAVLLFDQHSQRLEYTSGRGFRTPAIQRSSLRAGEGLAGCVVQERRTLGFHNLQENGDKFARPDLFEEEGFIAYFGVPLITKGQVKGVLEVYHRSNLPEDPGWLDFLEALAGQAAIAIENMRLYEDLQRYSVELAMAYDATLEGWSKALELRDRETEGHSHRVTELTVRLAREMGFKDLDLVNIRRGTLLHDIGKMGVPDSILLKPGPLNEDEWEVMRRHPVYAFEMIAHIPFLRPAIDIPYCHHERWDGSGYPRGLQGEQIPLPARIFSVVDVWDALRSDRPYRFAWPIQRVRKYLVEKARVHFDPHVVDLFLELVPQ